MISWAELRASLYGAYLLCRWDAQGFRWIDTSPAGALRSFWLAAYQLPLIAYLDWDLLGPSLALLNKGDGAGALLLVGWLVTYGFGWAVGVWYAMLVMRLSVAPALRRIALAAVLSVSNWLAALFLGAAILVMLAAPVFGHDTAAFLTLLMFLYVFVIMGFAFFRIFNGKLSLAAILAVGTFALSLYLMEQNKDLFDYLAQAS